VSEHRDPELSALYRSTAVEEPPIALDERILAAARRSLTTTPPRRRSTWVRWLAPMGLAATVVVSVSVVLLVERERPDLVNNELSAPAPAPAEPAAVRAPAAALSSSQPKAGVRSEPQRQRASALASPELHFESAPADVQVQKALPTPAPAPAQVPAPAAVPPAAAQATGAALKRQAEQALPVPEAWLAEIRNLLREQRLGEAHTRLDAFRRAYPDYPVPRDIEDQLHHD
jgi:hypothetical protein